jgi:pyruvate formate lyase activating enzyme
VKTSLEKYGRLGAKDTVDFLRAVEILKNGKVDYEFRATVVPGFVDEEDITKMGEIVKGGKCFAFQQFIPGDTLDKVFNNVNPYSPGVVGELASVMKRHVANVTVRV